MNKKLIITLLTMLGVTMVGQTIAGDLEVDGVKVLDDGKSTETLQGTYDTNQGTIDKSIQQDIQGGITDEQINSIIDTACSYTNIQCFRGDFNGDGKTDYVQINKDTGETKYYEYANSDTNIFREVRAGVINIFKPRVSSNTIVRVGIFYVSNSNDTIGGEGKKEIYFTLNGDRRNYYEGFYKLDLNTLTTQRLAMLPSRYDHNVPVYTYTMKDVNKKILYSYGYNGYNSYHGAMYGRVDQLYYSSTSYYNAGTRNPGYMIGGNGSYFIDGSKGKILYYKGDGQIGEENINLTLPSYAYPVLIKSFETDSYQVDIVNIRNTRDGANTNANIIIFIDKTTSIVKKIQYYDGAIFAKDDYTNTRNMPLGYENIKNDTIIFSFIIENSSNPYIVPLREIGLFKIDINNGLTYLNNFGRAISDYNDSIYHNWNYKPVFNIETDEILYCARSNNSPGRYIVSPECYVFKKNNDGTISKIADLTSFNRIHQENTERGYTYTNTNIDLVGITNLGILENNDGYIIPYMRLIELNGIKYLIGSFINESYSVGKATAGLLVYDIEHNRILENIAKREYAGTTWSFTSLHNSQLYLSSDMINNNQYTEDMSNQWEKINFKVPYMKRILFADSSMGSKLQGLINNYQIQNVRFYLKNEQYNNSYLPFYDQNGYSFTIRLNELTYVYYRRAKPRYYSYRGDYGYRNSYSDYRVWNSIQWDKSYMEFQYRPGVYKTLWLR